MTVTPEADLPCRDVVELVTEHLEGTLDPQTQHRLAQHLLECGGCEAYVEQIHLVGVLAAALPHEDVPSGLRAALLEAFRQDGRNV